jgi:alpha-glucuronidase
MAFAMNFARPIFTRPILAAALFCASLACAETGAAAWLRYAPLDVQTAKQYKDLPSRVIVLGDSPVLRSAQRELINGLGQMTGTSLSLEKKWLGADAKPVSAFVLSTGQIEDFYPPHRLAADGYWLKTLEVDGHKKHVIITGINDRGVLYGVFALLGKIARGEDVSTLDEVDNPHAPHRWVDQWDNLDGTIERGYGGPSIFFADGKVRDDLTRATEYARLLASIGVNGCAINNVNANPHVLDATFIAQVARVADAFRPWGVQLALSADVSAPKVLGDLDTFDPLDPRVIEWWKKKVDEIYRAIPDFGGFVVKADSEGRLGPSSYNRTQADAANVIARALKLHGGVVFYRAFVYNHHLDWHDLKNDRAKAAYDNFHPLNGMFDNNAIVQIKNGPIDFQVREPVSPLFAGLPHTNEAIELQITQEYTGQQRQLCFLVPMWKEVLDFDFHFSDMHTDNVPVDDKPATVANLVSGHIFRRGILHFTGGVVGVANVGLDPNWLGNPLAMANLYGFGRLAWNPDLSAEKIVDEWTRLTFGNDPLVVKTITALQLNSWHVYENYTGPLGAGTLTNITGNHYDPGPESSENNGWGQWHRADHDGIGMDRTVGTGTGFIGQYPPEVQNLYDSLKDCPDNLLLFFHHVPYTYVLHSGKTVIQHIYDSHYDGAEEAQNFASQWKTLHSHIDEQRYDEMLKLFEYQATEAVVWRDAICNWIFHLSGIPDKKGRLSSK